MVDSISTLELQTALKVVGFDPGPLDGVWGRRTLDAVKRFQVSKGLPGSGIVGPRTIAALVGAGGVDKAPTTLPIPWLEEAKRWVGLTETPGPGNTKEIVDWAQDLGASWYKQDSTPWCGVAVGHWIAEALPEEPLPNVPLRARDWLNWGVPLQRPSRGAVTVLERGAGGHVFLYWATSPDGKFVRGLGGNQGDKVRFDWFEERRVLGYRWPKTVHLPVSGPVIQGRGSDPLSTHEA